MNRKLCFSVSEAAEQLGVCRNHLYRFIDDGTLASYKLGMRRLVNREALDEFRLKLEKQHTDEQRGGES